MLMISLIVIQVLIFVAMIFILKRVISNNVMLATKHLEELNGEYTKKEAEVTRQLEEAKQKSEEIILKAKQEAEEFKASIVKETKSEADGIMKAARSKSDEIIQQADKAREHLLAEIDERVAGSSIDKATEIIHSTLPEKLRKDIHSQWVDELIEDGFSGTERLNIPKDTKAVKVVTAFGLESARRKSLSEKITKALGRDVTLEEVVDPGIVAGVVIHIGSLVLDGSLKNKIQEHAKNAKHALGR